MCEHCGVKSFMTAREVVEAALPLVPSANKSPSGSAATTKPTGSPNQGKTTPPLYSDRCSRHGNDAEPPPCGACADVRKAAKVRPLHAVPSPLRRCIVHDQSFERVCSGCRADQIAAEETA